MRARLLATVAAVALLAGAGVTNLSRAGAAPGIAFEANFSTPDDFYQRFDFGFSGQNPLAYGDGIRSFHGDHDTACGTPDTSRTVNLQGSASALDFSELFWWCAPNGAETGHMMTGVNTKGYNTAWFSPKPTFAQISRVCWDVNATEMGARKWWTVLFVGDDDAHRYPTGTPLNPSVNNQVARGTGGFDLGYTDPSFRQNDPNNGVFPFGGTLAGYRDVDRSASWFQNQDTWTTQFAYPNAVSAGTDKVTRYHYCLENVAPNTVRITQTTPAGELVRNMVGQIPQDARRVVFSDDNYNPSKDERWDDLHQTWHWDNILIFTEGAQTVPTTTTTASTSTTATTIATTTSASTTQPTSSSSTTSTFLPCPDDFSDPEEAWCREVMDRLDALEAA